MKKIFLKEDGQALVLVVLVMVISLTVGLAVSSQSLISSKQGILEEYSAKSYAAAEAGAEVALQSLNGCSGNECITSTPVSGSVGSDAAYEYTIASLGIEEATNIFEHKLEKDEVVQLNLTNDGESPVAPLNNVNVQVYWWCANANCQTAIDDDSGDATTRAAIEFTYLTETAGSYEVTLKEAYDSDDTGRIANNNFSAAVGGTTINGHTYTYYAGSGAYSFQTGTETQRLLRIRTWYNGAWVAVVLNGRSFSPQGFEVVSTGNSGTTERIVRVTKTLPYLPAIFDYVLFSGSDLNK